MGLDFSKNGLVWGGKEIPASVRTFSQMKMVLMSPEKGRMPSDAPTYFMYREAERFGSLRYDITRILPLDLCGERNKTYGHVHTASPSGIAYPEVYEVLQGEAHFLLQKVTQLGVQDAVLLSAKKGQCFMVPPDFGHVTINAGKTELVMANIVSDHFQSDYSGFTAMRGGCVYEKTDGKLVTNRNYGSDFEVRKMDAEKFSSSYACFAPFKKKSLLEAAKNGKNLEFLEWPEKFY